MVGRCEYGNHTTGMLFIQRPKRLSPPPPLVASSASDGIVSSGRGRPGTAPRTEREGKVLHITERKAGR